MPKNAPDIDGVFEPDAFEESVSPPQIEPKISVEWSEDERDAVEFIKANLEKRIYSDYQEAFILENNILSKVRTRLETPNGIVWATNPDGSVIEDWSRIDTKDLESFIQAASAEAFFASQRVIDGYAEAVFAKFTYDDAYDEAYSRILSGTIGDKTAKAKRETQRERWVALYRSLYYKKAKEVVDRLDAHVRRAERIYQERGKEADRQFRSARQ